MGAFQSLGDIEHGIIARKTPAIGHAKRKKAAMGKNVSSAEISPTGYRIILIAVLVLLGLCATQWERFKTDVLKWEPASTGSTQRDQNSAVTTQKATPTGLTQEKAPAQSKLKQEAAPKANPLLMKGLKLKDESGAIIYEGDIDLGSTLERIKKGEKFPHRNDGATFGNRERRLPQKPPGYYKEYVVPTPDLRGPGPQRLVIGEKGEVYYTSNHYASFKRVSVPVELLPGDNNK
jgi:ribonuclease T1